MSHGLIKQRRELDREQPARRPRMQEIMIGPIKLYIKFALDDKAGGPIPSFRRLLAASRFRPQSDRASINFDDLATFRNFDNEKD